MRRCENVAVEAAKDIFRLHVALLRAKYDAYGWVVVLVIDLGGDFSWNCSNYGHGDTARIHPRSG